MRKILFILYVFCSSLFMVACGHNGFVFSTGQYGNVGYDPSSNRVGVMYIDGQQVSILNRENTELEIEMEDGLDAEGKKIRTIHKIKYKIGKQANGYTVQMEKLKK